MNVEVCNTQYSHLKSFTSQPCTRSATCATEGVLLFDYLSQTASTVYGLKRLGSVLHHIGVTLSCVQWREEMFTLIDSRLVTPIQFIWKHHGVPYAFLKQATVKYLKHSERASLTDIQVVGRVSEVIMSDNVKGLRSDGTWYLCPFHFFQGEAPVPSCLLVSGQEMPEETQRKVKHNSDI